MADQISLPPTPPGLHDQMYRGDGGPQPMPPRAGNSLIVGGPAYFTPEGYQAPVQPTQSFMPTNVAPDPIRDQFNRQLPPIQRPQPPMPAPVQAPVPTQTGGVGDPAPVPDLTRIEGGPPVYAGGTPGFDMTRELTNDPNYVPPRRDAGAMPPENNFFVDGDGNLNVGDGIIRTMGSGPENSDSGRGPDRGSASPTYTPPPPPPPPEPKTAKELAMENYSPTGMTNEQLKISMDAGLPIPKADYPDFEAYLASLSAPVSAPEPEFVPPPTMPEPNGFFPGVTPDFSNLDFSGLSDLNLEDMDFSNLPGMMPPPVSPPAVATMPPPAPAPAPAPAPVYTPPPSRIETPQMGGRPSFDFSNSRNFNLR